MSHIFISHTTADDAFVKELRRALEAHKLTVWADSRKVRGGDKLNPAVEKAIWEASHVIVVISPETANSAWVRKEVACALDVERQKQTQGYSVIPLLLPGMKPSALGLWFPEEPVSISVELGPGKLDEAMPAILAALGERSPDDKQPQPAPAPALIDELILELCDATLPAVEGKRRARATATVIYQPAGDTKRAVESKRFVFEAPLGPIELDEIRWYLEEYDRWPVGVFKARAGQTEVKLPEWGRALYDAALGANAAREVVAAWTAPGNKGARRFSVKVERDPIEGADAAQQAEAEEAASSLLALPWELLHDGGGYLLYGKRPASVRRQMPNRQQQERSLLTPPIRILLVSPRAEVTDKGEPVGYFDHRSSALPLVGAVEELGELADVTVLAPPILGALRDELERAQEAGKPYAVVHFDGHGVYDKYKGLGALLFENPADVDKPQGRRMALIYADQIAEIMRGYGIPLVFLDACKTAETDAKPESSVAGKLLEHGVSSVVAMSHTVLVKAAERFVAAFYRGLAEGKRVGEAMLAGQKALKEDATRGTVAGAGELVLQDWFIPVLYQEPEDRQLFAVLPSKDAQRLAGQRRKLAFGALPETPKHTFVGRSYKLLVLERLLALEPFVVIRGTGGAGKTTIAAELARWLVRSGRFGRAAFVSVEEGEYRDARGVLDAIGRQLLPDGKHYSVAQFPDLDKALQPVERALRDDPTLIVIDNVESVLPGPDAPVTKIAEILALCTKLLEADPATRLVFTSRERLPGPFDGNTLELGPLSRDDAVRLVEHVMRLNGWRPPASDSGETAEEVNALVEAAYCHARALVLLAPEVARRGVTVVTHDLDKVMAGLERKSPGERENSLYASVELSLRRLPPQVREKVSALAVFQGGGHLGLLAMMMEVEPDEARRIAIALIEVGLGQDMGDGYLRLDPALPPYLVQGQPPDELEALRARWAGAMLALAGFLYEQQFKDGALAARLTVLELPNLLALLDWLPGHAAPEAVVDVAGSIEQLLANLGRPAALRRAVAARERATAGLGEWSRARFNAEAQTIERLLAAGDLPRALAAAESLLARSRAAGEGAPSGAYEGAAYDLAMAHNLLGKALSAAGQAGQALGPLAEAQRRFEALAAEGDSDATRSAAARMASACITRRADCLTALGRLGEAADAYEEAIRRDRARDDLRDVGVGIFQLGYVRLLQGRYDEALQACRESLSIDERLDEPRSIAADWHQIGMVYKEMEQFEAAEGAYRQALAINVQHRLRAEEANTLGELGNLCNDMGRLEEAVTFYRQAADICGSLGDLAGEGRKRSNVASVLAKLGRYDEARYAEARREIARAIECDKPFGHAAEPWKPWNIKCDVERATGNEAAAQEAWRNARDFYLAYRRDGGYAQSDPGKLCDWIWQQLQAGDRQGPKRAIADARQAGWAEPFLAALAAIVDGARDPKLAEDPELYYRDSAELILLLERLNAA